MAAPSGNFAAPVGNISTNSNAPSGSSSANQNSTEKDFQNFYSEVKDIEKEDSVLTSEQQIERLLRPGSTYFNLNPFEVLQVGSDLSMNDIKQKYRRMSILVHPDKNPNNQEKAQKAFEIVNNAYKTLESEEGYKYCKDIIQEAKEYVEFMLTNRRKQLKKEGKGEVLPEDTDPERMNRTTYVQTTKMFADRERKKKDLEAKDQEMRKREREKELDEQEDVTVKKEWDKNFEESRTERVASWNKFSKQQTKKKKSKYVTGTFKPPKTRMEKRL